MSTSGERSEASLLVALGTSIVLGTFGFVLLGPFFPEIAADLDSTVPLLGQVSAVRLLLAAALGLIAGPLADGFGHRRVMTVGLVAAALTLLGIGTAPTYWALAATALPGAVAAATLTGLSLAVAGSAFAGAARRRAIGWTIGAQSVSGIVGVPLLVAVGDVIGWRPLFLGCGVLGLLVVPAVVRALPDDARSAGRSWRRTISWSRLAAAYRPLLRHGPALRLFAVTGLRSITWGAWVTYFGAYLKEEGGISSGLVGLAFFLAGLGFFAGSVAAGGRLGLVPPRLLTGGGDIVTALLIGLFFAAPAPGWVALALGALSGFFGAFAYVGVSSLLAGIAGAGTGTTMTLNGSLFSLGSAGGGVLGGLLLSLGGYVAVGMVAPLFMAAAALVALARAGSSERRTEASGPIVPTGDERATAEHRPASAPQPGP